MTAGSKVILGLVVKILKNFAEGRKDGRITRFFARSCIGRICGYDLEGGVYGRELIGDEGGN